MTVKSASKDLLPEGLPPFCIAWTSSLP